MNNLVTVINKDGQLVVTSRQVARDFKKEHRAVLKAIDDLIAEMGVAQNYADLFLPSEYQHEQNRQTYREYLLTRDGFSLLVMGFTGKRALEWKLKYIEAFNAMEESLKQVSTMLTEEQKLQLAIFQAKTIDEAGQAAAALDRYRQKQLADKQRELEHKTEVIKGVTDDIDIYTKRNVLNKVVRFKGANFKERWNELYDRFREVHSVDLKARCEGYNLKQKKKKDHLSIIKYAEKFGYIDDLYRIALKLYETDISEILRHLQKIA